MNDLTDLLDRAAGPVDPRTPTAVHADLSRGHRALARTRVRRTATGLLGVAAAGAFGVGLTRQGGHDATTVATAPGTLSTPTATTTPGTPQGQDRPGLSFEQPPAGWEVQGITADSVTFGQPGDSPHPNDVGSKIYVTLELNEPFGEPRVVEGRTFWVDEADRDNYHTATVMTLSTDHPRVLIRAQFGEHRWDVESALAFVAGVQVLDAAEPMRG